MSYRMKFNQRGMTLIEVLAATAIGVIVISAATLLYVGIHGMWESSSNRYTLDAEKKQIAGLFTNRLAEATNIEIERNKLTFSYHNAPHELMLTPIPNSSRYTLTYSYGHPNPISLVLSEHIEVVELNGVNITTLNPPFPAATDGILSFQFHFNLNKAHDRLSIDLKLLQAQIHGQD